MDLTMDQAPTARRAPSPAPSPAQDACPLCDNHCPADDLGCGKGVAHFRALSAAGR